jgi:hypothetical protein
MNLFNDLIHHLDLVEIAFQGQSFTWSNMQTDPLLEKLDWVFTSIDWSLSFPDTKVLPLDRPILDHIPYVVHIGTQIPKSSIFCLKTTRLNLQVSKIQLNSISITIFIMEMMHVLLPVNLSNSNKVSKLRAKNIPG